MIICQPYRQNHQEEQQRANATVQQAQNKRNRRSKKTYASELMKKKMYTKTQKLKQVRNSDFHKSQPRHIFIPTCVCDLAYKLYKFLSARKYYVSKLALKRIIQSTFNFILSFLFKRGTFKLTNKLSMSCP